MVDEKPGSGKWAPLTDAVREVLDEIRAEQKRKKISNINGLIFVDDKGKPITGARVDQARHAALRRSGVKDFRLHDSRHYAVTNWARRKISTKVAMLAAGHSSLAMSAWYTHLLESDVASEFGTARAAPQEAPEPRARAKKTR